MTFYITPKYINNTFEREDVVNHFKGIVDTTMQGVDMSMVNKIIEAMDVGQQTVLRASNAVAEAARINTVYGEAIKKMIEINKAMELRYKNCHLCAMLGEISRLELTNLKNSKNVYPNGLYPLPAKIPDLDLWLSAISDRNKIHVGIDNKARCIKLVDYEEKRTFEAMAIASAPLYMNSRDKGNPTLGIENKSVLDVNPTTSVFKLTEGPPVVLGKEFTVFRIIRTGSANTKFKMFGDMSGVSSIYANTQNNECITISNSSENIVSTPTQSTKQDAVSVACLVVGRNFKWSANGVSDLTPFNGTGIKSYTEPTTPVILDTLFGGGSTGEFVEVLIYQRALSTVEIETLTDYFSMVYSSSQSMQLVLSVLEQQ